MTDTKYRPYVVRTVAEKGLLSAHFTDDLADRACMQANAEAERLGLHVRYEVAAAAEVDA